jgi:hypothetical protein
MIKVYFSHLLLSIGGSVLIFGYFKYYRLFMKIICGGVSYCFCFCFYFCVCVFLNEGGGGNICFFSSVVERVFLVLLCVFLFFCLAFSVYFLFVEGCLVFSFGYQ